jgi:cob(I)alamin adenosyltransferase
MIAIIACTKSKLNAQNIEARLLYFKSNLFRLSYQVIKKYHPDLPIFILSAKYGLIPEDQMVSSYNVTLKEMNKEQKEEFKKRIPEVDDFIFIGGNEYKAVLPKAPFKEYGEGLPIGKKMQYLKSIL